MKIKEALKKIAQKESKESKIVWYLEKIPFEKRIDLKQKKIAEDLKINEGTVSRIIDDLVFGDIPRYPEMRLKQIYKEREERYLKDLQDPWTIITKAQMIMLKAGIPAEEINKLMEKGNFADILNLE